MLDSTYISAAEQLANDIAALSADYPDGKRAAALARLRSRAAKVRANLRTKGDELTRLYFEALKGNSSPSEIETAAEILHDHEIAVIERLGPRIEMLQQKLAVNSQIDPEVQAAIDLALAWLGLYAVHRIALSKLAAERRGVPPKVLRARPIEGPIDYRELIREHMARYPKIRAALAR